MTFFYRRPRASSFMNRLSRHIVPFLLFLLPGLLLGQREDEIWYFGDHAGLDFRSGAPVVLTNSAMYQWEGSSVMSDRNTGALLLYTDGQTVWNRNHQPMPGGTGLFGSNTSTQSAIITPMPRDSTRFYIFTVDAGEYSGRSLGVHYSIVDMKLDGGLGAVTVRNAPMYGSAAEKLVVVRHCNGRGYWVLVHDAHTDRFVAFEVTPAGVSTTPVFSSVGSSHGSGNSSSIGYMRLSPSLKRLAVAVSQANTVELFDFDNRTGKVSNPVAVPVGTGSPNFEGKLVCYGVCFSPDETKLYVSGDDSDYLVQFDITSRDPNTIRASRYVLHEIVDYQTGAIQLGPDNRIYVTTAKYVEPWLGVINNPNLAGAACGYNMRAISLQGKRANIGLPNFVDGAYDTRFDICKPPTARFTISDTIICAGTCITFTESSFDDPLQWEWSFPGGVPSSSTSRDPGTVCYPNGGEYEVRLVVTNANGSDTMIRRVFVRPAPAITVTRDTLICSGGGSARLSATGDANVVSYVWSPAQTLSCSTCPDPIATPIATTTYTVTATTVDGCQSQRSVTVATAPLLAVDAGRDTAICLGGSVTLRARGAASYAWEPDPSITCSVCSTMVVTPRVTTTYRLTGRDATGCFGTDSVVVRVVPPPVIEVPNLARLCMGDSIMLQTSGSGSFTWSPAEGLSCTSCASPMAFPTKTTTYYLTAVGELGCRTADSIVVVVDPAPRVVRAHIDAGYGIYPGVQITVPVRLDDRLDLTKVTAFDFSLTYDPGMLQLVKATLDSLLLAGWQILSSTSDPSRGVYSARIISLPPRPLSGTGDLLHLTFLPFIGTARSSDLAFDIGIQSGSCTRIVTSPGSIRLDSICGLDFRLIEGSASKYSLGAVTPNPLGDRAAFNFSLGLDGPTTLEVFDESGRRVALLVDRLLEPGSYSVVWDASDRPQGVYYFRLRSGDWNQSGRMIIRR
jgi:PKD repeat protein